MNRIFLYILIGLSLAVSNAQIVPFGFMQETVVSSGYDSDYQAVLDEATLQGYTLPSSLEQDNQNAIVVALKSHSLWTGIDAMWYFKGDGDSDFKNINWKNPTGTKASEVGAGALTYSSTGVLGDAVNYLDLGWNPTDDGVNYLQNDFSITIDIVTTNTTSGSLLEGLDVGDARSIAFNNSNTFQYFHSTGNGSRTTIDLSTSGFFVLDFLTDTIYASKDGAASFKTSTGKITDSFPAIDFGLLKIGSSGRGDMEIGSIVFASSLGGVTIEYTNIYNSIINGI